MKFILFNLSNTVWFFVSAFWLNKIYNKPLSKDREAYKFYSYCWYTAKWMLAALIGLSFCGEEVASFIAVSGVLMPVVLLSGGALCGMWYSKFLNSKKQKAVQEHGRQYLIENQPELYKLLLKDIEYKHYGINLDLVEQSTLDYLVENLSFDKPTCPLGIDCRSMSGAINGRKNTCPNYKLCLEGKCLIDLDS